MRRFLSNLIAAGLLLSLWPAAATAKLKIVTTTTDLKSIVEAVGGDKVEVNAIGTGREDPHFIDAKPSCMILAKDADLWVRVGLELEIGYEGLILDGSRNTKIRIGTPGHFDAADGVIRLEVPTGKVDRSMGDIHPLGNPHYWLDPLNMRIVAKNMTARLSKLDAADAPYFAARLAAFEHRLDEAMFGPKLLAATTGSKLWSMSLRGTLDDFAKQHGGATPADGWWGTMHALAGTKILTYHRSWSYFANRFGLNVVDELEPKPGIEPTPTHLEDVVKKIEAEHVKFLLMEPFYSRQAPDWLAHKTGIKIVNVANSVGGQPEATDYIAMINNVVTRCAEAVKP